MQTVLTASKNFFKGAVKPLKNNKGLTLMELLAVILILGVIAGIAIPVLSGQGEKSRVTAHESNVATIEGAAERYATELGFDSAVATTDFGEIVSTHEMITEAYLKDVPENPWEGTNHAAKNSLYFTGKDSRNVVYVVLADAAPTAGTSEVITIDTDGNAVKSAISTVLPAGTYNFGGADFTF
ncbi:prepilin-type N-terminal cleavage/methylation domain-containing protein (plasmid) [Rossellomorea sp. AcN35-11]|nr:type II secretion system GspH family protein [Rossellomorea aquimaris]WJV32313.1 prepilin-type N-terminal cleavage/methylation domain-containing protein [Rossellomorea sp. AcN35-11]